MTELLAVARILKKPLDDVYELGKSRFQFQLDKWKSDRNINALYKKVSSIQNVKTIWQVDKEINIKKFYYPSKLIIDDNTETISQIKKIPSETNVVIQGTVGQGKSIFLRYLCSQELRTGSKVPIFFELRKVQKEKTLKHHLSIVLDSWGFEINDELFDFLADSGKFIFLLDGFDEIDPSIVGNIVNELEFFSEKYPNLQILVTSRPDSGIEKSAYFRVYNLAPLKRQDYEGVLKKLINNEEQEQNILKALNNSSTQINALLTTPLMMTLLVLVYKAEQKIPEQFSEFYGNLFQTLLLRHDKSKPGYVRAKNCPINERKLQEIFEAFCFLASKESLTTLNLEKIHELANNAIQNTKIECDASSFIKDISKIACLVIEEGFDYHFIHKSVREYHAANFIKRRPDEFVIKFYQAMLEGKWDDWYQELNFLSQVDEYRFTKYFLIPYIEGILRKVDSIGGYKDVKEIKEMTFTLNMNLSRIISIRNCDNPIFLKQIMSYAEISFNLLHDRRVLKNKKEEIFKKSTLATESRHPFEIVDINAIELFEIAGLIPEFLKLISERDDNLRLIYKEKCQFLENEERKSDMLDF
ncbi:MAG: NACHT domain-containing protein [Methylococcales bacterium]|nr:NACHT domain-containing protein [Methylococcales bacterium]